MSKDDGFVIPVHGNATAPEVKLLAVDVYARGIERDMDVFQEVNKVTVILNDRMTHSFMLSGLEREQFISGWHWHWCLEKPFVVADMSTKGQTSLMAILVPRMEMKRVWEVYETDPRFRAWTWPVLDGVDSDEPEWFKKWKEGKLDLPEGEDV